MKWHAIHEIIDYETLEQLITAGENNVAGLQNVMFSLEDSNYPITYLFNTKHMIICLFLLLLKKLKCGKILQRNKHLIFL